MQLSGPGGPWRGGGSQIISDSLSWVADHQSERRADDGSGQAVCARVSAARRAPAKELPEGEGQVRGDRDGRPFLRFGDDLEEALGYVDPPGLGKYAVDRHQTQSWMIQPCRPLMFGTVRWWSLTAGLLRGRSADRSMGCRCCGCRERRAVGGRCAPIVRR